MPDLHDLYSVDRVFPGSRDLFDTNLAHIPVHACVTVLLQMMQNGRYLPGNRC